MTIRQHAHRVATLAALLAVIAADARAQVAAAPKARPALGAGGTSQLEVEGQRVPALAVDGGFPVAQVITNDLGPDGVAKKHVASIRFAPFAVRLDPGTMGKPMFDWIQATLDKTVAPKNGVVAPPAVEKGAAGMTATFTNAILTRIAFTGLDLARPGCQLEVTFDAEQVRLARGGMASGPMDKSPGGQCVSFRVELSGLEAASGAVVRIDSIVVTQAFATDQVGILREPAKHPAKVTVANVTLTLPEARAQDVLDWTKSWMIDGNHLEKDERTLTVALRDSRSKDFLTLQGTGVGLVSMRSVVEMSGQRMVQVELYVERWKMAGTPLS